MRDGHVHSAQQVQALRVRTEQVVLALEGPAAEPDGERQPGKLCRATQDNAPAPVADCGLELRPAHATQVLGQFGRSGFGRGRDAGPHGHGEQGTLVSGQLDGRLLRAAVSADKEEDSHGRP